MRLRHALLRQRATRPVRRGQSRVKAAETRCGGGTAHGCRDGTKEETASLDTRTTEVRGRPMLGVARFEAAYEAIFFRIADCQALESL